MTLSTADSFLHKGEFYVSRAAGELEGSGSPSLEQREELEEGRRALLVYNKNTKKSHPFG